VAYDKVPDQHLPDGKETKSGRAECEEQVNVNLDNWLTVHRSITLVDFQLDAQNSYLFTSNTFIIILYMFQEVYVVNVYICSLWYCHSLQVTVLCTG
jgi:hypothetical protein